MYRYEYETVYIGCNGFGLINGKIYSIEDYRQIIDKRAKEGWKYVGYIPTKQRGTGHIEEIDLVFEKVNN